MEPIFVFLAVGIGRYQKTATSHVVCLVSLSTTAIWIGQIKFVAVDGLKSTVL